MPSLDSVTFDVSGLTLQGDREGVRVWHTPAGDGIGLYYFPIPPDIEADLRSVSAIRAFYRALAMQSGAAIIEVDILQVNGCSAVRQIIKVPQQPHGMTYLGSITLPFRNFSYVIKIQCEEHGTTGIRDSVILAQKRATGEVTLDVDKHALRGWMRDPYDPSIVDVFARNLSEADEYDKHFPDHPLSRLRPVLKHVQATLRIAEEVKGEPRFERIGHQKAKKSWWKVW
jgi:hypothetical protein